MDTFKLIVGIGSFFYLLTCLAFLDIARKDFGSIGKKAMWGVIAFIPFIGVVIYAAIGYRKGKISVPQPSPSELD